MKYNCSLKYFYSIGFLAFIVTLLACGESRKPSSNQNKNASKETIKSEENNPEGKMSAEQIEVAQLLIEKHTDISGIDTKKLYKLHCAVCHGFKGNAMINGATDLTKSKANLKDAVAQVYFGKGLMNPFKGVLKDNEIVAISKYTESLRK